MTIEIRATELTCEGCHGSGRNWTCGGVNENSDHGCSCEDCTDCSACQECGGSGVYDCDCGGEHHQQLCDCAEDNDDPR